MDETLRPDAAARNRRRAQLKSRTPRLVRATAVDSPGATADPVRDPKSIGRDPDA